MERLVHVGNGDSTADSLTLADLPGESRVWADSLDQGPVLPVGDAEHYKVRGEFWTTRGRNAADTAQQLATWDKDFDEAAGAEELILWFVHDLFDQLALVRLLSRLSRRGLPKTLTIVSIDRHPEVPNFLGLGARRCRATRSMKRARPGSRPPRPIRARCRSSSGVRRPCPSSPARASV